MGIDLVDVVKAPRIRIVYETAHGAVKGIKIPVRDLLLKPSRDDGHEVISLTFVSATSLYSFKR